MLTAYHLAEPRPAGRRMKAAGKAWHAKPRLARTGDDPRCHWEGKLKMAFHLLQQLKADVRCWGCCWRRT